MYGVILIPSLLIEHKIIVILNRSTDSITIVEQALFRNLYCWTL